MNAMSMYPAAAPRAPELTIRRVKGIDAPAVAELRALWSAGEPPGSLFTSSIRAWLEADGESRITLMASADDRPIGMISMLECSGMPVPRARSSRWGYIDHLFVRDGERRQGVATALINETMDTADHREYQKLLVSPSAMAISLFHRLGFLMLEELGPEGILLFRPRPRADAGTPL